MALLPDGLRFLIRSARFSRLKIYHLEKMGNKP